MTQNSFIEELKKINIEVTDEMLNQLEKYYEMLIEYNKVMNLTGITEKDEVYLKHFYDSLTLNKIINLNEVKSLCDLGSGAGFPGIVLKIVFPQIEITLVDSLNKRINFLNEVIKKLGLKKIQTVSTRIEEYAVLHEEEYEIVTARAVAPLNILLELGSNLISIGGYFVAMKGNIENEPDYANSMSKLNLSEVNKVVFNLPIEESIRTLIQIKKESKTPKKFPRRYSEIKNRPL